MSKRFVHFPPVLYPSVEFGSTCRGMLISFVEVVCILIRDLYNHVHLKHRYKTSLSFVFTNEIRNLNLFAVDIDPHQPTTFLRAQIEW